MRLLHNAFGFMQNKALRVFALMMGLTLGLTSSLSAQATPIPLQEIDLDWTAFATTLGGKLAAVIAVAIGVGIGVWLVSLLYRKFKSMSRG